MESKKVLLTFDYELFLGKKSGSVENCLLLPTESILNILDKYKIPSVFFVDATYLLKLKELKDSYTNVASDYAKIVAQIRKMISGGHDVYLHLHPHWKDAQYLPEINQWKLEEF